MKVAVYCRVSTDKEVQYNSFEYQQKYFADYVNNNPDWVLYKIYADKGVSGTSIKNRVAFQAMINDAYEGKFGLIITKEISRFSRSIQDTINYTMDLKKIGVGVIFVSDFINTLNPADQTRLSTMGSYAQDESRKISDRVTAGQVNQMKKGVVFGQSLLGYDVHNGKMTINDEGAQLVRLIFQMYAVQQVSTTQIAKHLTAHGYRTYKGSTNWTSSKLTKILHNEKYVGDLVQQKTYTPDYLDHEKKRNKGEKELIVIKDHHEPIISRELWDLTQQRLQENNKHNQSSEQHSNRYIFSGKIKCGECGASYVGHRKRLKDGTKIRRWCCGTADTKGVAACSVGKLVRDDDAIHMLQTAISNLDIDRDALARDVTALVMRAMTASADKNADNPTQLQEMISRTQAKKSAVLADYYDGILTREEMQDLKQRYDEELASLQQRLDTAEAGPPRPQDNKDAIRTEIIQLLDGTQESEVLYKHLLDRLMVYKDRHMELRLKHMPQVYHFK